MVKKTLMFFVSILFVVSVCFGQTGTTGVINGTVNDPDGVALPGITVLLKSPALVLPQLTTVTNASGVYRFMGLAPGIYELTFALEGMNTLVREGIIVGVGKTATVDVEMALKTIEESIVVSGKTPTIDRQSTTKTANLDSNFLDTVPVIRTLANYFNMTPGVTASVANGSSERTNAYNLDGVNLNDPVVGTQAISFGVDIMEEISVQTGGISAEYGNVQGAVINVVSKSGGNQFSGQVSYYYRNEDMQSDNTQGTPLEGESSGAKFEKEPSISFGGPIKKDMLWFFGNYTSNFRETNVAGYPYGGTTEIPTDWKQTMPFVKLTFQPGQNDKITFAYNFDNLQRNHRGADRFTTEEGTWAQEGPTHVYNANWAHTFSGNVYANIRAGGYNGGFNLMCKSDTLQSYSYDTYTWAGNAGFDQINIRDRLQVDADVTAFIDDFAGSHELKFGAQYSYGWDTWKWGMYGNTDPMGWYPHYYTTYGGTVYYAVYRLALEQIQEQQTISLFVQDTWKIGKNITLNLGVRFENAKGIIPKQNEDAAEAYFAPWIYGNTRPLTGAVTENIVGLKWNTLAPRLGLIYDIFSDGTTLFKATYSRYYTPMNTQWFNGMNPNMQGWYYGPADENLNVYQIWGSSSSTPFTAGYGNYDVKNPKTDEVTIGIERELWEDFSASIRYIRKWDRDLIEDVNASALDMDALMDNGELVWTNFTPHPVTDPYDGQTKNFWDKIDPSIEGEFYLVNPPGADRDFTGVEVIFNKRFSKGWSMNASYVYQKSTGLIGTDFADTSSIESYFDTPHVHENARGRFVFERRHQFKLNGFVKGPWGFNLSGYLWAASGRRYSREISSVEMGVSIANDTGQNINAEPRGSYGYPNRVTLDLKLEKVFKIGNFSLSAFVDCFNVFNEGVAQGDDNTDGVWMTSTNSVYEFGEMLAITGARIFRVGAKIEF